MVGQQMSHRAIAALEQAAKPVEREVRREGIDTKLADA